MFSLPPRGTAWNQTCEAGSGGFRAISGRTTADHLYKVRLPQCSCKLLHPSQLGSQPTGLQKLDAPAFKSADKIPRQTGFHRLHFGPACGEARVAIYRQDICLAHLFTQGLYPDDERVNGPPRLGDKWLFLQQTRRATQEPSQQTLAHCLRSWSEPIVLHIHHLKSWNSPI